MDSECAHDNAEGDSAGRRDLPGFDLVGQEFLLVRTKRASLPVIGPLPCPDNFKFESGLFRASPSAEQHFKGSFDEERDKYERSDHLETFSGVVSSEAHKVGIGENCDQNKGYDHQKQDDTDCVDNIWFCHPFSSQRMLICIAIESLRSYKFDVFDRMKFPRTECGLPPPAMPRGRMNTVVKAQSGDCAGNTVRKFFFQFEPV